MILPKNCWLETTRDFLTDRQSVNECEVAWAIGWPSGHYLTAEMMQWIAQTLTGLKWRRRAGSPVWRR